MTTPTLEETIRNLVARGDLSHVSLAMNSSHTKWRASFTPCSTFGTTFSENEDPVKALMLAITTTKLKTRNPRVKPIAQETVTMDETAEGLATTDEYLAGIAAKTAAQTEDVEDLM